MISAPQVPTQHFWCHPLRQWAILIPHESVHHEVLLKRRVIDLWCNRSLQLISYEFFRYCGGLCSEPLWISWLSNFIMIDWEADRTHRVIYSTHLFFFFFFAFRCTSTSCHSCSLLQLTPSPLGCIWLTCTTSQISHTCFQSAISDTIYIIDSDRLIAR